MTFLTQVANSTEWNRDTRDRRDVESADPAGGKADRSAETVGFIAPTRRSAVLSRFVEAEILPRLALSRATAATGKSETGVTTERDTTELVRLLMDHDDDAAWGFTRRLEQLGVTPASLYLGVISDAARRLGWLWEEDRADFALVTIGLGRLQQIVRALSPGFQQSAIGHSAHADTILLLPAPGEQHTLGLVILSEFFHREGWHLLGGPMSKGQNPAAMVRDNWVDVAGFSLASVSHLHALAGCIRAVRKASRNAYIAVMVGGPLFLQRPELVKSVGADSTAADAPTAVRQARGFLALRSAAD
jgi:methanogenic corrinoid protein MtbC1